MSARLTISDLPAKFQAAAYAQLGKGKPLGQARAAAVAKVPAQIIRQRTGDGMNKWERDFLDCLKGSYSGELTTIHREVSLPIGNGVRYKLDFLVGLKFSKDTQGSMVSGYEVKGQRRAAGIVKLKVAAGLYPWITFWLVTKGRESGAWTFQEVQP